MGERVRMQMHFNIRRSLPSASVITHLVTAVTTYRRVGHAGNDSVHRNTLGLYNTPGVPSPQDLSSDLVHIIRSQQSVYTIVSQAYTFPIFPMNINQIHKQEIPSFVAAWSLHMVGPMGNDSAEDAWVYMMMMIPRKDPARISFRFNPIHIKSIAVHIFTPMLLQGSWTISYHGNESL